MSERQTKGKKLFTKEQRIASEEKLLLDTFRGIESQHVRNAVLVLVSDVGWGHTTEIADRRSLDSFLRSMGVKNAGA